MRPTIVGAHGIGDDALARVSHHALHHGDPRLLFKLLLHCGSEWQQVVAILHHVSILDADAQLLKQVIADCTAIGGDMVEELNILGLWQRLVVDIDHAVLDAQPVARQTQTAFDIVLTTIDRAIYNFAEAVGVGQNVLATEFQALGVVVGILRLERHGVASREVKHHDVATLDLAQTLQSVISQLRLVDVALAVEERQGVLCQREVQGCLRHARTIDHLVDPQEVTREQGLLER